MIQNYEQYKMYLEADRVASEKKNTIKDYFFDEIWKFQRSLRKREYLVNTKKNYLRKLFEAIKFRKLGRKLGFSIPLNVFGPGLAIVHAGTIVVSKYAKIGANCRVNVCVNIGASGGTNAAPQIGDNCYIGPGAKIFGDICLGDNIAIGANAVVNKSFPEANITIGGIPARKISDSSSLNLLKRVT